MYYMGNTKVSAVHMFHGPYMETWYTCSLWTEEHSQVTLGLEITIQYFVFKSIRVQQMFASCTICCLATVKVFAEF